MKRIPILIIFCFAGIFMAESQESKPKQVTPKTSTVNHSTKPVATKTAATTTTTATKTLTAKTASKSVANHVPKTSTVKKTITPGTAKSTAKTAAVNHSTKSISKPVVESTVTPDTKTTVAGNKSPLVPSKSKTYPYLAYTPQGYNENDKKEWPIIIYLHGSSCKGNNLEKLKKYGPPFYLERGMQVDAIVISPQCPTNKNWTVGTWFESFYKELKEKYNFDPSRVYLTGMSLGGFGTWDLASRYPDYFAAVVPLCGGGRTGMVETMKDIPTWVFHGDLDQKVRLSRSEEMVNAMKNLGSEPKFSVLKGQGHSIQKVYSDQSLYQWLLSHQKNAYNKILEFSSFWTPKVDSVSSAINEQRKNLATKIFPIPQTLLDKKKSNAKVSLFELFSKKQTYTQETLH